MIKAVLCAICAHRTMAVRGLFCAVAWIAAVLPDAGLGVEYEWIAESGSYYDSGNWDPTGPPGPIDTAVFNRESTYTVIFPHTRNIPPFSTDPPDPNNRRLIVREDDVTLDLSGNVFGPDRTYTLTALDDWTSQPSLILGAGARALPRGSGRLTIVGGALSGVDAVLGPGSTGGVFNFARSGQLTVSTDATANFRNLTVGYNAPGVLNIVDGGQVTALPLIGWSSGVDGSVIIDGDNSSLEASNLHIGVFGEGELMIQNGGTLNTTITETIFASEVDSSGVATVQGGSTWTSSERLIIGDRGMGTLNIQDGGKVESPDPVIADQASSVGEVNVTGADSELSITSGGTQTLTVGRSGAGMLTISAGGRVANSHATIARDEASAGIVIVDGVDLDGPSEWSTIDLIVGDAGEGEMIVRNGGRVTTSLRGLIGEGGLSGGMHIGSGEVTVTDSDSVWQLNGELRVGVSGTGSLTVANGAAVSNTFALIGASLNAPGTGTVVVIGPGSAWTNIGALTIGGSGGPGLHSGTLTIADGGVVSNTSGAIGATGLVQVADADSAWTNSELLTIDRGSLSISSGGTVSSHGGVIGPATADVMSSAVVDDSLWTGDGDLIVGDAGLATLTIQNGGQAFSAMGFIGKTAAQGTVTVAGSDSAWAVAGSLFVGGDADMAGGMGTLNILDAGAVDASQVVRVYSTGLVNLELGTIGADQLQLVGGTLSGEGTVDANVSNSGTIVPGNGIGVLILAGDYQQASDGLLELELAGILPGQADHVAISGEAILDGTLEVLLGGGFVPLAGNEFEILTTSDGNMTGVFDAVNFPALSEGLSWHIDYTSHAVTLQVLSALLVGDYNGNGLVEQADLDLVLANWGNNGTPPPGGWINDLPTGIIDQAELDSVLANWGSALAENVVAAVPEPATAAVLLITLVTCSFGLRRR